MWAFNHQSGAGKSLSDEQMKANDAAVDAAGGILAEVGLEIGDEAATWERTPYAFVGAKSVKGVGGDCSGSTWLIYKAVGLNYEYVDANRFRLNADSGIGPFRRVYFPRPGDVVAFAGHVGVVKGMGPHGLEMWTAFRIYEDGKNVPYGSNVIKWWGKPVLGYYRYVKSEKAQ
jgi:cell wall-associated NlpC family hydrolase